MSQVVPVSEAPSAAPRDEASPTPKSSSSPTIDDARSSPVLRGRKRSTERFRLMPSLVAPEPRGQRWVGVAVALLITALFALAVLHYLWSPAHDGVDQNGYLVGGKQYAKTFSTGLKLDDPLAFIGNMWVYIPQTQTYYPKYPIGLPMMYAACLWIFGAAPGAFGYIAVHAVSPVLATLGVLATFFLGRALAGTYAGLIAMLMMAASQYTLSFAYNPNSHASSFGVVTWGMFLLIRYMQTGSAWRGAAAGFLLGFAVLTRYTEGLLLLPLGLACLTMLRWRDWRSWLWLTLPAIAWAIPVAYQLGYNKVLMGAWTSYGPTNESTGFKLEVLLGDWDRTLHTLNDGGLYFAFALGVLGLLLMPFVRFRAGMVLWAWVLPSVLLYGAYYWAPNASPGFGRFFFTQFPAIVVAGAWLLCTYVRPSPTLLATRADRGRAGEARAELGQVAFGGRGSGGDSPSRFDSSAPSASIASGVRRERVAATVAIAVVVAVACAVPAMRSARFGEPGDRFVLLGPARYNANLAHLGQDLVRVVPPGALLISETSLLHHLQFAGDWTVIDQRMFNYQDVMNQVSRPRRLDADDPDPYDPGRMQYLKELYATKSDGTMNAEFDRVARGALEKGRRVFLCVRQGTWTVFSKRFVGDRYDVKVLQPFIESTAALSEIEKLDPDKRPPQPITGVTARRGGGRSFGRAVAARFEIVELKLKAP